MTVRPACENLQPYSALWNFEQGQVKLFFWPTTTAPRAPDPTVAPLLALRSRTPRLCLGKKKRGSWRACCHFGVEHNKNLRATLRGRVGQVSDELEATGRPITSSWRMKFGGVACRVEGAA